ncbi:hypothetical protein QQS21_001021 [Conoideocrella luteorostrata]|uniref:Pentatricopeptide repeat domain-containing protein n=1 Tax=Conoideocrella luteorostrata TaxID=1105319 RepID=A0AAJ0CXU7_9HYPO|nr:hypothetical protein QQS21_001021 [Conoideocrella luteorostrata]
MLGQGRIREATKLGIRRISVSAKKPLQTLPEVIDLTFQASDTESLAHLAKTIHRKHGDNGLWELFELLQRNEHLEILGRSDAHLLRDEFLTAALATNSRLTLLVDAAHRLMSKENFHWPDLYMKIMHHMLENGRYEDSIRWHLRLTPKFPPTTNVLGALLSSFVVDSSPQMQSNLTALYVMSPDKRLYDHIVPILFAAGLSKLARIWRKKLLIFRDFPITTKSKPFLQFLAQYYPFIALTEEELAIAGVTNEAVKDTTFSVDNNDSNRGQYSDSIVAKWFASSWTSAEFAINLAQRLGLRVIGPKSLQSLALREADAKTFALRLARIEKLGINISSQTYCKVLVYFAKYDQDLLFADLLASDIHPDEFEGRETRQMLMALSIRERDWKRERLLQGVEWAIESEPSSHRFDALLSHELAKHKFDKARKVLDRMEALKINMDQQSATHLLQRTFLGIGKHPPKRKRQIGNPQTNHETELNRAIDITRRVALHDVAIPLQYWKLLLCNLGRSGRLDELEQLCEEITQLYSPPLGGLVPICSEDLPRIVSKRRDLIYPALHGAMAATDFDGNGSHSHGHKSANNNLGIFEGLATNNKKPRFSNLNRKQAALTASSSRGSRTPNREAVNTDVGVLGTQRCWVQYIPADLPFSHRQHPIHKIFDTHLQRSIIRWGFDQRLKATPSFVSLTSSKHCPISAFDVASGVRLLARLRDLGVVIDLQVLQATVLSRIALGYVPGRQKDRSRDKHELSLENLKLLFDGAWGSEILPDRLELTQKLEEQKPKLWNRYPKLFGQSFDGRHQDNT